MRKIELLLKAQILQELYVDLCENNPGDESRIGWCEATEFVLDEIQRTHKHLTDVGPHTCVGTI